MDGFINKVAGRMKYVEAKIYRELAEADVRLAELELDRAKLLRVRTRALAMVANANLFFALNAPGTLAYHFGIAGLREEFVGKKWRVDRPNGVECIRNDALKLRVAFVNVQRACSDSVYPQPRTQKGAGSERLGAGLFEHLPEYAPAQAPGWSLFYLMVDQFGAAELTKPVIEGGLFTFWPVRIYLSDGSDLKLEPMLGLDEGDVAEEFDPQVIRKL